MLTYIKISGIIAVVLLVLSCGGNADLSDKKGSMDWHLFRGDAALSGYTETKLPENPELLWTFKTETRTVSSPVISNGTTYWCDRRGNIRGVDINGSLVFTYNLQTAVEATPMIYDSTLFIGRIDGFLNAISIPKKEILWSYETLGQISASPNIVDFGGQKAVLFGSYDNFLYSVNLKDGKEINKFESGYYLNGAVSLYKKYAIFGGCDSWLRIINCKTGVPSDSLLLEAYIPASPAIMGDYCYVGDYAGNIYELQLEKGKIVRHKKIMKASNENASFVSVPAITGDALYILSDDRYLYSLNRKDGTVNWKYMLKGDIGESSPVVCRDKVIVCTKTGIISILDTAKGKPTWEYDAGEQIIGSPAIIKNHFMILTAKGTLLCFGSNKK